MKFSVEYSPYIYVYHLLFVDIFNKSYLVSYTILNKIAPIIIFLITIAAIYVSKVLLSKIKKHEFSQR